MKETAVFHASRRAIKGVLRDGRPPPYQCHRETAVFSASHREIERVLRDGRSLHNSQFTVHHSQFGTAVPFYATIFLR